jgi:alpha-N-acetylglucosamine transferase
LTLFQIEVDDVEEWTKIDQLNEEIVIMSTIKRKIDNEEWAAVQTKIQAWKHRF